MKPSVAELKKHIKVNTSSEDPLLQAFIDAAYDKAALYCNADFATLYPTALPRSVHVAVLMLAGTLYAQRESVGATPAALAETTHGFRFLLQPYRVYPTT